MFRVVLYFLQDVATIISYYEMTINKLNKVIENIRHQTNIWNMSYYEFNTYEQNEAKFE